MNNNSLRNAEGHQMLTRPRNCEWRNCVWRRDAWDRETACEAEMYHVMNEACG